MQSDLYLSRCSGLLLAYSTMRALERSKGRFNYLQFAVNMYLRFYPAVFGTILMYYLLPLVGDGPFWHTVDRYHVESCRTDLIPNLLSYNFYVIDFESFVAHSMVSGRFKRGEISSTFVLFTSATSGPGGSLPASISSSSLLCCCCLCTVLPKQSFW